MPSPGFQKHEEAGLGETDLLQILRWQTWEGCAAMAGWDSQPYL